MGHILFAFGIVALLALAWRGAVLNCLRGIDAVGAGLVLAFAGLSLSATVLSAFGALTGVTWVVAIAAIALGAFVWRAPGCTVARESGLSRLHLLVLLVPALIVGYSQFVTPIAEFDDLMYHGSRAGYWLGQQSVLPFPTHNERQSAFPYAGDLLFAFGVFTARSELLGRMFVFAAYPVLLLLVAGMLRQQSVPAYLSIGTAWIIGVTPQVREAATGIKPDLWGLVFALVAVHAAWRYLDASPSIGERSRNAVVLLAALCAAVAVKFTFLLLAPLAAILLFGSVPRGVRVLWFASAACWLLVFGIAITLINNKAREGGWLGSPGMMSVSRPDSLSDAAVRHLSRLPFVVVGMPVIPSEPLRQRAEHAIRAIADGVGATEALPLENADRAWPGLFVPPVERADTRFSLLWVFGLIALTAAIARWKRLSTDVGARLALLTVGVGAMLSVGVAITVRWQSASGVPERFLVPGITIGCIGLAWLWHLTIPPRRAVLALAAALAVLHALPFVNATRHSVASGAAAAIEARNRSSLASAAEVIPPGSQVLLLASQNAADYVLFHPDQGFPTRVVPWGRREFKDYAFRDAVENLGVDTVVIERPDVLSYHWNAELSVTPFVDFLSRHHRFARRCDDLPNVVFVRDAGDDDIDTCPALSASSDRSETEVSE